jgi:hypothetical protein
MKGGGEMTNLLFAFPNASRRGEDFINLSSNELTLSSAKTSRELVFPRLTI